MTQIQAGYQWKASGQSQTESVDLVIPHSDLHFDSNLRLIL